MHARSINLGVTDATGETLDVPQGAHKVSIQIEPTTTATGWTVGLDYKIDDGTTSATNAPTWLAFSPVVTFTSAAPAQPKVSVTGRTHLRLRTTTADGEAGNAEYTVRFA